MAAHPQAKREARQIEHSSTLKHQPDGLVTLIAEAEQLTHWPEVFLGKYKGPSSRLHVMAI